MGRLDNKVAIVTGGGSGIGKAISLEFAREGADVAIASRSLTKLEKVVDEIKALGRRSLAIATDVRVKEQVQDMVKQTVNEFGKIDILVNNSGVIRRAVLWDVTEEDWDAMVDTNLKSVFLCTQAVAKQMMEQKYGKIVNIASAAGRGCHQPWLSTYAATKAGVIELTRCYARDLGPYNVNVNAIAPGFIETPIIYINRTEEEVEKIRQFHRERAVVGRIGTPEDIAKLTVYLVSDDSSFISGQALPIDGGRTDRM